VSPGRSGRRRLDFERALPTWTRRASFLIDRVTVGDALRAARLSLLQRELNPLGLVYVAYAVSSLALRQAA
jgi:hypothetical protein